MKVFTSTSNTGRSVTVVANKIATVWTESVGLNVWELRVSTLASDKAITLARGTQLFVTRQYDLLLDELCGGPRGPASYGDGHGYEHIVESEEL